MAKAKKARKKSKVRDLKPRKMIKGGSKIGGRISAEPCEGGEYSGKIG